jgi:hypothetical protein
MPGLLCVCTAGCRGVDRLLLMICEVRPQVSAWWRAPSQAPLSWSDFINMKSSRIIFMVTAVPTINLQALCTVHGGNRTTYELATRTGCVCT